MSIGIDSTSTYLSTQANAESASTSSLKSTLGTNLSSASDEKLLSVCKNFESYLVEQVMKEMEKTVPKSEEEDSSMSQLTDYYKDNMIQELSSTFCEKTDLGIAQTMYEQMKRNYSTD